MREYSLTIKGTSYVVGINRVTDDEVVAEVNGVRHVVAINDVKNLSTPAEPAAKATKPGRPVSATTPVSIHSASAAPAGGGTICSPIPGHILEIVVGVGDKVLAGQKLLVLEAMKMENIITADQAGVVTKILVRTGDAVTHGQAMVEIG